jgi:hypothetical protein
MIYYLVLIKNKISKIERIECAVSYTQKNLSSYVRIPINSIYNIFKKILK